VTAIGETAGLARKLAEVNPDIVLINLADPSRDMLEQVSAASDAKGRPVAMFVDQSDDTMSQAAVAAGLSAYVVGDPAPERIKPVLATAIARFQMMAQMRKELEAAKQALSDRKTIDRAKGVLMRAQGISEDEAYSLLRRKAMEGGRKVIDVAEALLTAADLLK
ncbi:MAG: ANTAR domain-containing protein, partial [Pseudomonadota bacterium]